MHAKPDSWSSLKNHVFDSSEAQFDLKNADISVYLNCPEPHTNIGQRLCHLCVFYASESNLQPKVFPEERGVT